MRRLHDRLLLVLAGTVAAAAAFGWMVVADRLLGLTREVHLFIGGALVYGVTTLYLARAVLRRLDRMAKALAVITVESPIVVFGLLFSSGLVPWPGPMLPYVGAGMLIGPVMTEVAERLFRSRH